MNITRYNFGEAVRLSVTRSGDVVYWKENRYVVLDDDRREVPSIDVLNTPSSPEPRRPFERTDFGDRDRLVWSAGACAIPQDAQLLYWDRFAAWSDGAATVVADATESKIVRIGLQLELATLRSSLIKDGTMWIVGGKSVTVLQTAALAGLFVVPASAGPTIEVTFHEHYPWRRAAARAHRVVSYIFSDYTSLTDSDGAWCQTRLPIIAGLEPGMRIVLHDELMKDVYLEYELPGQPRRPIHAQPFPTTAVRSVEVRAEPAVDPAGELVSASPLARTGDLDRLFAMLADDPDEASRVVIVDLLEDAGEPYAPLFASLLAGEAGDGVRDRALGMLTNFITDVEWAANLPRGGTLSPTAPLDDALIDLVAADHRLGFFHTLRLGEANFRIYNQLIAAPRAVGLRHVDGSRSQILAALIEAKRRSLRRLSSIKFAQREVIAALADSTFDSVVEVETETQARVVEALLEYIIRDDMRFFARAPRHLILVERLSHDEQLVEPVLAKWGRLPLDKLTFGGVTIARDGTATASDFANEFVKQRVAAKFEF